jgi:hypothetical protein
MRIDSDTAAAVLIMLLLLPLAGCLFSREIAHTRRDIEGAYPDLRLERQIVLNLGPVSLATIRWLADLLPEDEADMAAVYLHDVSRVKIGLFRSDNPPALDAFDVDHIGFDDDWETAVKVRDDESRVWVLFREGEDTIRDLYVVVLDEEDLAIARVRGNLSRLLAHIMEDHVDLTRLVGDGT